MNFLILYLFTAFCWACYAASMTRYVFGKDGKVWLSLVINFLICPLAIMIAVYHNLVYNDK